MPFEKRDMSGVLFKNDRRQNDKQPEYTGTATIGGQDVFVSAWVKTGQKGKFFSLAFKWRTEQQQAAPPNQQRQLDQLTSTTTLDIDDEIPF